MPGYVIYHGPSQLDKKPIVVVAILETTNQKTGPMVQTYILRADIDPLTANKYGEDYSICGDCDLRGDPTLDPDRKIAENRRCYVTLYQAPLTVFKTYVNGGYGYRTRPEQIRKLGHGRKVRIGSYGDGAAVPLQVWLDLTLYAHGHTAYTHRLADPGLFMISVESHDAARRQWHDGRRTFRVVTHTDQIDKANEVQCPNDTHGVQCYTCMLCSGADKPGKSVAIVAHGPGSKYFNQGA